ncbi:MAG: GNAT family N-acetyltransferase [Acidimicrobiia bacterium]|nr:GNAT family N-acetyltransferase [Acidimicrobiia bacterium]
MQRNRIWLIWLGLATVLTIVYFAVPNTPESKLVLYNGLGLLSVASMLIGIRVNRATPQEPWLWFAAGLTSFLTADVIYYVLELGSPEGPPFPSVADPFYLMMYPLMIVGLTKMVRAVRPDDHGDAATFIDAAVVGIAMFGALWVLFVDTVFETGDHTTAALLTQLAYPVMDVALLAVAARLAVTLHLKHPPFALILGGLGSLAIADTAYGIYNAAGTFQTGLFIDAFWLAFYALFAAAALHPDVRSPGQAPISEDKLTGRQLVIMFFATLGVPLIDLIWGTQADRVVTIGASAMLFLLILVRVFGLMQTIQVGQDKLRYDAGHDSLTGLTNRTLFSERIEAALENPDRGVSVLFIDLDDFKNVNDSLGHAAGDALLAEVADRLTSCVGPDDTVARFGGDEFAVLLTQTPQRRDVVSIARRTLDTIHDPIDLGARNVRASASIGIATYDDHTKDVESLLRNADVAMYLSKTRGKGCFEFFESQMHEEAIERLDLKADLQRALDEDQFILHYQPIFDLDTGAVSLVEALVRWKHPERGVILPDRFIPLAEESGVIVKIGEWVLREACLQAASWSNIEGCDDINVTVNLSMRQLQDNQLINSLTRALKDSGLDASRLVLEITESMLALDPDRSAEILGQLKTIGVKLALDDFGTGYSSLSYLRSFPVDSIKIDRSFIHELHRSSTSTALIDAVVNLAKALGAYTVAEGIEYSDQAQLLRKLGCDRGQGFYYCRPLASAALTALFKEPLASESEPLEAWRRSSELAQQRLFDVEVRRGLPAIRAVAKDISALNSELGIPVMGSWPWLNAWAESFQNWTPMMVDLRSAETGELTGYALLAYMERAQGSAIVTMGHGSSLFAALPARDDDSANALADAIASTLDEMPGAWSLELEQIHDLDHTLLQLADQLEHAQVLPELRVPRVIFSSAHHIDDVLSKSMRKQIRRAERRISNDGRDMAIAFDRGQAISMELIDEVESVHVARDRDARRNSDLDRPSEREFWRRVVEAADGNWEVEIATLRLDGELAAYVVALLDGDTYRVYDGRMSTKFGDYSPGRIIEAEALHRAMTDPRFAVLDWMSGVAAEKLLTANIAEGRARLVATSGSRYLSASRIPASSGVSA